MILAIDGFSEASNIKEVSHLGVQWLGLDFVSDSPRKVHQLSTLSGILPDSPLLGAVDLASGAALVGVFRDEMPQTIVTRIYNFHLSVVRLDGVESPVMIDNLRRTVDPDIHPGLHIVKTLHIQKPEDLLSAQCYAGHADYLLLDMADAQLAWLDSFDSPLPFLIRGCWIDDAAQQLLAYRHSQLVGFSFGEEMERSLGLIDVEKARRLVALRSSIGG